MDKINFVNKGQPAINDTNLNKMQDNIEKAAEGTVLYENTSGTTGDITLSNDSFTNYKRIKVFGYYNYNKGEIKTNVEVEFQPNVSIRPSIYGFVVGGATQYLFVQEYNLSSNKLSKYRSGFSTIKTNGYEVDSVNHYIYITKIIGFKD